MNISKKNVSIVGYLNTKPFIFGLTKHAIWNSMNLKLDIPSICASNFKSGKSNLALIPVAELLNINNYKIVTDFCIGAIDYVDTVCLLSNDNLESINTIYLDHHSRTSVKLINVLAKEFWNLSIKFVDHQNVKDLKLKKNEGKLMIGDKVIGESDNFTNLIDLGHEWFKFTNLPFVFAVWVADSEINDKFLVGFNEALKDGVENIEKLKYLLQSPHKDFDLQKYYKKHIYYNFGPEQKKGLDKFLNYIK